LDAIADDFKRAAARHRRAACGAAGLDDLHAAIAVDELRPTRNSSGEICAAGADKLGAALLDGAACRPT
jgi:hypothetical protein